MPINSSFVAFERNIISEDNVSQSMRPALQKTLHLLPRHDSKVSYQYEQEVFHFLVENEIVYACTTSGPYENRVVFGFLIQVKDAFKTAFTGSVDRYPRRSELTSTRCQSFSLALASSRKVFNENPQVDKIGRIKDQLNTTREVMLQNLDSILERGERIDNLCDRTELLQEEAQGFHSNASTLKRAILMHNIKIIIGVVIFLGVLALVIAFCVCGIDFKKC
ncbi:putative vesicle-associated membrane protein (vamp) [Leptomonas pyrrhocoris]|uniref:Putative vesicle-associated membrane protein (Vamp) n=1 Tax=Leptomonas pyrrhocoris TaxID=157538 RepID=A0A0M9G7L8_LEPPY|nr:putative vesicle-associated membrane protein (vamp) [Leptomonas pyrrhocoris]XP_015662642.1 putative vesicle-associated membrane protein (vamp) [Leptomonas pyrrhocoris]KPA84202.1 putative vesicle-associated membrane protein (vamp) [Leptomonas pyrrhocoris]KPA84203.1 putative vesicle-associated membrane protein (vamp) [Leptomonas pyrrhocoris]|eukprot:XP_015662641.1 putative vesicle-associated membrane protein (vamp) [Leptomonas pyrrhocoris]